MTGCKPCATLVDTSSKLSATEGAFLPDKHVEQHKKTSLTAYSDADGLGARTHIGLLPDTVFFLEITCCLGHPNSNLLFHDPKLNIAELLMQLLKRLGCVIYRLSYMFPYERLISCTVTMSLQFIYLTTRYNINTLNI